MDFEWNAGNLREINRHQLYPADVEDAIQSERPFILPPALRNGEWRIFLIGRTKQGRILVVIFTYRADRIRVVTAYPARPRDERRYRSSR